jgi:hypothetical protein
MQRSAINNIVKSKWFGVTTLPNKIYCETPIQEIYLHFHFLGSRNVDNDKRKVLIKSVCF